MSGDEELAPAVCDCCGSGDTRATKYISIEPPHGETNPDDSLYVCDACLLRAARIIGECEVPTALALISEDYEPPGAWLAVVLEVDGPELGSTCVCKQHAKELCALRILRPPVIH